MKSRVEPADKMKGLSGLLRNNGITLIELIIVISVIAILIVALGFSFQGWKGRYKIETEFKEMNIDIMNARARALQRNRMQFVQLGTTSYTIYEDTTPAPDGNGTLETATDARVVAKTFDPGHTITWSELADVRIDFNQRGFSTEAADKIICSNTDFDADYDCMIISTSRINLGKLTTALPAGGTCVSANCVAR